MTDRSRASHSSSSEGKKSTGRLNRSQLEHALRRALDSGPALLSHQIRYILALGQLIGARPATTSYPEIPMTVSEARLSALVHLAEELTATQREALCQDVRQLHDDDIRLPLLVALLTKLPEQSYQDS